MDKRCDIFGTIYACKDLSEALECGRMHTCSHDGEFQLTKSKVLD